MELAVIVAVGVLVGTGVYGMLQKNLLRVVLGTSLVSHGVNLLLLTSGRLKRSAAPILEATGPIHDSPPGDSSGAAGAVEALKGVTDPLPQALILTAIVIGFATTALLLVIVYRTYESHGSDNLEHLKEDGA